MKIISTLPSIIEYIITQLLTNFVIQQLIFDKSVIDIMIPYQTLIKMKN